MSGTEIGDIHSGIIDMDSTGTPNTKEEHALSVSRQTEEHFDRGDRYAFQPE